MANEREAPPESWDAFVSHASQDKEYVRQLVTELERLGARVWYDETELKPGDSLVASIDRGLARSRHGVLVLTPAFLGRPWTEYERRGLTSRDVAEGNVLVPIWRGVDREEVAQLSPTLGDKVAVVASGTSTTEVALRVLAILRPDRFDSLARRAAFDAQVRGGEPQRVALSELNPDGVPLRHETLPGGLLLRIRVIHQVFAEVSGLDWDETVRLYKGDLYPDREVGSWEAMSAVYLKLRRELDLQAEGRHELYGAVLLASMGDWEALEAATFDHISPERVRAAYEELGHLIRAHNPES